MHNPYSYEVDEHEILVSERGKVFGERLTSFNCRVCQESFTEAELSAIRSAHAPFRHAHKCNDSTLYYRTGDDVRAGTPDDKYLQATKEVYVGRVLLLPGDIAAYNGKSIIVRPCGYAPDTDAETNDTAAVDIAIRRGWLKPYIKPEDRPINKAIAWLKNLGQK